MSGFSLVVMSRSYSSFPCFGFGGFSSCCSQALEHGFSSCGTRLNCSPVCGIFLDKVKPVSSVLVGGFLSTAPPGKPIFAFPSLLYFLIIFCPKSFSCPFLTSHLSVFQFCFCLFPLSIRVIPAASNRYVNQTCLFSHTTANLERGQVPGG